MAKAILPAVLLLAACASQPESERPYVERPEGMTNSSAASPELTAYRETLAEQRAVTREQENALLMSPSSLTTEPDVPWYDTVLGTAADVMYFIRNNF